MADYREMNGLLVPIRYAEATRPPMGEVSVTETPYYARYKITPYNPDDLALKKGGIKIYDEMMRDDQVKALYYLKVRTRLSTGWSIQPASEDPRDVEAAEFVRWVLKAMRGTLESDLRDILTAMRYGFSVSELVWEIIDRGPYRGKVGLRAIKGRKPHNFDFDVEENGDVKPDGIIHRLPGGDVRYPVNKFVLYAYNNEFGNPYGESDLRAAYRSWWSKNVIIKFWNIYLERFGMPTVVGRYKAAGAIGPIGAGGVATSKDQETLEDIIDKIQTATGITLPDHLRIDLLEAQRQGEAGYEKAIEKHNTMIARSMLIPAKMGFTEEESGSYNLGEKHFDLFMATISDLGRDLEEAVMGEQVIRRLVDYNFQVDAYPQFKFGEMTKEDKAKAMQEFKEAIGAGVLDPNRKADMDHMRKRMEYPEFADDAEWESWQADKEARQQKQWAMGDPGAAGRQRDQAPDGDKGGKPPRQFSAPDGVELTPYERKVNFAEVGRFLDQAEARLVSGLQGVVRRQRDELLRAVREQFDTLKTDPAQVEKLQIGQVGAFRRELARAFMAVYGQGKADVRQELDLQVTVDTFAASDFPGPEKFFEAKAFTVAGVEREWILKEAKMALYNAIKNGDTLDTVIFRLGEVFAAAYLPDSPLLSPSRLETITRTSLNEAYNEGRLAQMADPDLGDFVPAVQYSAILDARTTPFCRSMHGRILKRGDPLVKKYTPPNHFNCRSLWVPVTKREPYQVSPPPELQPAVGFALEEERCRHAG